MLPTPTAFPAPGCFAYHGNERTATPSPYPGLETFKVIRKDRDYHWGEGTSIDDPNFRLGGDD